MKRHELIRRIAASGIMLAFALILSIVESLLPPIIPALPYAKIGLTNIVLLACFLLVGVWEGYVVLILKCLLAAVYAGNMAMLIWSLPSAFVAYTVMVLLAKTKIFSTTGLSIAGGMLHNFTQILVATIVVGTSVFFYLPYMLLAGGLAGLATGIVCHFAVVAVKAVYGKKNADKREDENIDETDESEDRIEEVDNNVVDDKQQECGDDKMSAVTNDETVDDLPN